eukprot:2526335-Prorocentrum_lima.AAC.1
MTSSLVGSEMCIRDSMKEKYSEKVEAWPEIGCGARFVPWARGASMVMEVQMSDGSWEAFMAE